MWPEHFHIMLLIASCSIKAWTLGELKSKYVINTSAHASKRINDQSIPEIHGADYSPDEYQVGVSCIAPKSLSRTLSPEHLLTLFKIFFVKHLLTFCVDFYKFYPIIWKFKGKFKKSSTTTTSPSKLTIFSWPCRSHEKQTPGYVVER